jgi:hypothetical protein
MMIGRSPHFGLKRSLPLFLVLPLLFGDCRPAGSQEVAPPAVEFATRPDGLAITIGGKPFAVYVFEDGAITRPFFKDVHAPDGTRVTRNYPPVEGKDRTDHATMHPGLWMAFGDLSRADSWRNKDRIRHAGFIEAPRGGPGRGEFVVKNRHEKGGRAIAEEFARITILAQRDHNLLLWDSTFRPLETDLTFGDQEEMGLGIRMATPLSVPRGGTITNSDGLKNEARAWGKAADWCAFGGSIDGHPVEVVLMTHPENFRRSWFHARDYGLLVANPFGRNAFTLGEKSQVVVKTGGSLRLRFGVAFRTGAAASSAGTPASYREYLRASGTE